MTGQVKQTLNKHLFLYSTHLSRFLPETSTELGQSVKKFTVSAADFADHTTVLNLYIGCVVNIKE